jgi:hypothetical protein
MHTFITALDLSRGKEQTPWHLLYLGIFISFLPAKRKTCFLAQKILRDLNLNVTHFGSTSIEREGKFLGHLQVVTLKFLKKFEPALTLKVFPCVVIQE